jgi:hypothetical protein
MLGDWGALGVEAAERKAAAEPELPRSRQERVVERQREVEVISAEIDAWDKEERVRWMVRRHWLALVLILPTWIAWLVVAITNPGAQSAAAWGVGAGTGVCLFLIGVLRTMVPGNARSQASNVRR